MSPWLLTLKMQDERLLHALVVRRRRPADLLMTTITHLGGASVTVGLTLLLTFGALPGAGVVGMTAAIALILSHLGVQLLKRTIVRPRPRLPLGHDALVWAPDRFSFPSGHAAAALSVGLPISLALPAIAGGIVLAISVLVGVSRCYLGVHYPGDVLAGWTLAIGGVLLAAMIL